MKIACLVLLMMLSPLGFKPTNPDGASSISQSLIQTVARNKQHVDTPQVGQALASATTVPPAAASKVPPAKAKNAGAPPCSRQSAVNHDAQVIPSTDRTQWPQSRFPTEKQKQCQTPKPLHKPPSN